MGDTLLEVLTSSARDLLKLKLSPKPGMVLMDMVLIHTLMVDMDTHTLMVDIMDTESRLVNFYNSIRKLDVINYKCVKNNSFFLNCIRPKFSKQYTCVKFYKTVIKKTME